MKIVQIADTHRGLSQFNRLDPESGMNLREKQIYDNFSDNALFAFIANFFPPHFSLPES